MRQDHVDRILDQWDRERPDLDTWTMGILGRLRRASDHVSAQQRAFHALNGLQPGEFDLLATLRRSGAPFALTAGELAASAMLTPGAITHRVDGLVERDLVARTEDTRDRRSVHISLTDEGRRLIDILVERHVTNQQSILERLPMDEREDVSNALRVLLIALEPD